MSMAGEGPSYEQGGGAGGKFRKRQFRRSQTTPYDRPPIAIRNPRNGWLSKLVDPASKLISASAHMFFSSVFRKRLCPPQPSSGPSQEPTQPKDVLQNPPGAEAFSINDVGTSNNGSDSSGFSDLEQMLKQKTFTRSEIDRLTELLHSRTADLPVGDADKGTDANLPKPVSTFERQEEFATGPMQENGIEGHGLHGIVSTPVVSSRVLEENIASPAELAKAYMGSRPSKVSPSMLGLRSQALRQDENLLNSIQFAPKSPIVSLAQKTAVHVGARENGFITPRSRGRSAIYSMARTPYSRVYSTANQKGMGSTNDGQLSSIQGVLERAESFGSKQVALRRRSSVLDVDIGSIGPIRRTRQKLNLLSPKNLSLPVSRCPLSSHTMGVDSDAPTSSSQKLLPLDDAKVPKMLGENERNSIHSTSFAFVSSKSTEVATKIFQQLDKLSQKEKSMECKLVAAKDELSAKLTPSMSSGKVHRSMEDVDSLKFLHNAQDSSKLEDLHDTSHIDIHDSTSQKQVEQNGPKTLVIPGDVLAPAVNSVDTPVSVKDSVPTFGNAYSAAANFVAQSPLKKQAFQMNAYQDYLELDYDVHSNGNVSMQPAEGREKLKMPVVESKSAATQAVTLDKNPAMSDVRLHAASGLIKKTELETNDGFVAGEKSTRFTFPTAPAPSKTLQPPLLTPQTTPAFDKIVPPKEPNVLPPSFSFGSKNVEKNSPFQFSSTSSVNEYSGPKYSPLADSKLESSNSFANFASGTTDTAQEVLDSDEGDNKNMQNAEDVMGKSEPVFPSTTSTSMSKSSIFSFGAPVNNSSLNNGPLASSPFIFSSSSAVLPSSNLASQSFTNSSLHIDSATITSTGTTIMPAASSSSLTITAPALSFPAAPIFRFGSSVASSTSVSTLACSGVQSTDSRVNTEKGTTFGNLATSLFSGPSSAMTSTGGSLFGFTASATSSTVNNQPQGYVFGSGSLGGMQSTPAGTAVASVLQTIPVQFGSSVSPPVLGSTGTILGSSVSLFGSSTPAAKLFSSGTTFGLISSGSSSETNCVSSSMSSTSSLFGSSRQPSKSPTFSALSGSSLFNSPSPSTGFSFGASSTAVAATNNAPSMVFGSSTGTLSGSIFSFTSAVASTSSSFAQTQPVFGNSMSSFTTSGNSDQMNMEDSMAEDTVQVPTPAVPAFSELPVSPSGVMFGTSAPSATLPFQFGGQQNLATPQNPSSFQASGSLEFGAGGSSFSLGTVGSDKSNRRIIRVKHKNRKK